MIARTQYAHPERRRVPAKAKTEWRIKRTLANPVGVLTVGWPHKARSKYMPHQSLRELERRCRQMYGEDK